MDRQPALAALSSDDLGERLAAARALIRLAQPGDASAIRARLRVETVPWVQKALGRALSAASIRTAGPEVDPPAESAWAGEAEPDEAFAEAIYASAVQEVSERLVHELRKVLGRVRYFSENEIADQSSSRTIAHLTRMQDFLDGVESLGNAASVAANEEFDLAKVLAEEVEGSDESYSTSVEILGPDVLAVRGDSALVRHVVSNGLKNALEACSEHAAGVPIVLTYGVTDVDHWLAILDRGPGVPDSTAALFEIGETTKKGHPGLGLAIAHRAARSLGGELHLGNDDDGVTRFELRWPRRPES